MDAGRERRACGFLLDLVAIGAFGAMVGLMSPASVGGTTAAAPFIAVAYLLFRDVTGASLGKRILGLRVVGVDNIEIGYARRILRNVTLATAPLLEMFPGHLAGVIFLIEVLFLLTRGERLGDQLARTRVVLESPDSAPGDKASTSRQR